MQYNRDFTLKIVSYTDNRTANAGQVRKIATYEIKKGTDVEFTVSRDDSDSPDTANFTIYNLHLPDIFSGDRSQVELYAGYLDNTGLIYRGDITSAKTNKKVDRSIYISCGDGVEIAKTKPNKNYGENVDFGTIVDDMLEGVKKAGGEIVAGVADTIKDLVSDKKTVSGVSPKKGIKDTINQLLSKTNSKIVTYNNEVKVLDKKTGLVDGVIINLDRNTGLVGSWEKGFTIEEGKKVDSVNVTALINPQIMIGRRISLSPDGGTWIIKKMNISGGTKSGNWYMNITGVQR